MRELRRDEVLTGLSDDLSATPRCHIYFLPQRADERLWSTVRSTGWFGVALVLGEAVQKRPCRILYGAVNALLCKLEFILDPCHKAHILWNLVSPLNPEVLKKPGEFMGSFGVCLQDSIHSAHRVPDGYQLVAVLRRLVQYTFSSVNDFFQSNRRTSICDNVRILKSHSDPS